MSGAEEIIADLNHLKPRHRAALRKSAADHIAGRCEMPKIGPPGFDHADYSAVRRAAIEEAYKRRVSGQTWSVKHDKAFHV